MALRVDTAGNTAGADEFEPRVIWFGSRRVDVRAVVDRWYGATHKWWKVRTDEGDYVLRLDTDALQWELAAVVGQ